MKTLFMVHGYKFDPSSSGSSNPHYSFYPTWQSNLGEELGTEAKGFAYYSAGGWTGPLKAWMNGYRNSYRYAYSKLAPAASRDLAVKIIGEGESNVICHSLGSRVTLGAIRLGAPVKICVILNGAEMVSVARSIAKFNKDTQFFNVLSKTDSVVSILAEKLTPGGGGDAIGNDGIADLPNWTNIVIDDHDTIWAAREHYGWDIRGDNLKRISDHRISHEWVGNWQMYRHLLEEGEVSHLPDAIRG
ncbi:MAG: hypothetical protein ACXABY_26025 [Candidatus Thorarchaeota archaeon]|jgi:hypothetical protein